MIWTSKTRTRQPRAGNYRGVANSVSDAALVYVPTNYKNATVGGPLSLSGANSPLFAEDNDGVYHYADTTASEGSGLVSTPRYATGTLTGATLIVLQKITNTSDLSGWHDFQSTAVNTHMPYSGVSYFSTFATSRWLSWATLPASVNQAHVVVVRANGTERKVWINGTVLGSGTADSTVQWSSYCIGTPNAGIRNYSKTYALLVIPRAVSDEFITNLRPDNFWQLFAPQRTPVFYSISGSSSAVVASYRMRRPGLSRVWR